MSSRSPVSIKTKKAHEMSAREGNSNANRIVSEELLVGKRHTDLSSVECGRNYYSEYRSAVASHTYGVKDTRSRFDFLVRDLERLDSGKFRSARIWNAVDTVEVSLSTYTKKIVISWDGVVFHMACGKWHEDVKDTGKVLRLVNDVHEFACLVPSVF